MVVRKKKKSRKLRGRTRSMGWGRIGQHRKSGARGGFGAVGFHKHKWMWALKYAPNWYGKHGFTRPPETIYGVYSINVGELDELAKHLVSKNLAYREEGKIVIDVTSMGFNKVLGRGRVTLPLKIITKSISEKAREKITAVGGEVVVIGEKQQ
ncbi:uL15 family ribosomal protein [Staphylothermus hellenicus]|uniref:Large ribosomal subunit protein uL15 n=1 Tax=Staphylothermus hellenicus (strain DSM 12710 / JCM 10830 / BK20S6-10-b1 / P8) TaxID=591019 RepID=D7D9R4_STAHD|nr:uL15 family ribosomal protein [Staphylothermus hellenicus]ADI32510.1 ribosomal protein L15 [Staphylothermus hellenicus DSM 12710]